MSVQANDTVFLVWEVFGERRRLYAVASTYAAALLAAPMTAYVIEEWTVR